MTRGRVWYAETVGEDLPRFAFRKTARGILGWVERAYAERNAEIRIVSPEGQHSRLTYGGFWVTLQDLELAKAIGEREA